MRKEETIAAIRHEQAKAAAKQRKLETRRKVLVGAVILQQVQQGTLTQEWLDQLLQVGLTRARDRKVFGLDE